MSNPHECHKSRAEGSARIVDFIDAGAADSEPVKGITQGDLRRWYDDIEGILRLADTLDTEARSTADAIRAWRTRVFQLEF